MTITHQAGIEILPATRRGADRRLQPQGDVYPFGIEPAILDIRPRWGISTKVAKDHRRTDAGRKKQTPHPHA